MRFNELKIVWLGNEILWNHIFVLWIHVLILYTISDFFVIALYCRFLLFICQKPIGRIQEIPLTNVSLLSLSIYLRQSITKAEVALCFVFRAICNFATIMQVRLDLIVQRVRKWLGYLQGTVGRLIKPVQRPDFNFKTLYSYSIKHTIFYTSYNSLQNSI